MSHVPTLAGMADPDLQRAHEDVELLALTRRRLTVCSNQLTDLEETLHVLERQHAKEVADVDVLTRTSLKRIMTKLTGNHDEKLAEEEAEVVAARMRADGHRVRVEQMRADKIALAQQVSELANAPQRLQAAMATAEQRLISSGDPSGKEMLSLTEQIAKNAAVRREHAEARDAGVAAVNAVNQVLLTLRKALGWSTGDVFGLPFADWAEHERLDDAAQLCWHAQRYIDVFARECNDVAIEVQATMPQVDTRRFADFFFDGIIVDSIRHNRIEQTVNYVAQVGQYLDAKVDEVGQRLNRLKTAADALEIRRRDLLGLNNVS